MLGFLFSIECHLPSLNCQEPKTGFESFFRFYRLDKNHCTNMSRFGGGGYQGGYSLSEYSTTGTDASTEYAPTERTRSDNDPSVVSTAFSTDTRGNDYVEPREPSRSRTRGRDGDRGGYSAFLSPPASAPYKGYEPDGSDAGYKPRYKTPSAHRNEIMSL